MFFDNKSDKITYIRFPSHLKIIEILVLPVRVERKYGVSAL